MPIATAPLRCEIVGCPFPAIPIGTGYALDDRERVICPRCAEELAALADTARAGALV